MTGVEEEERICEAGPQDAGERVRKASAYAEMRVRKRGVDTLTGGARQVEYTGRWIQVHRPVCVRRRCYRGGRYFVAS